MASFDAAVSAKRPFHEVDLMGIVAVPSDPIFPVSEESVAPVLFWCRDCREFVEVDKHPSKLQFKCKKCSGGNVAFGTAKSMKNFYGERH